jgi:hypothetical protein
VCQQTVVCVCVHAQVKITAIVHPYGMEKQTAWCDEAAAAGVLQHTITVGETPLAEFVRLGSCLYVPVTNLRCATLERDGPQHEVDGGKQQWRGFVWCMRHCQ